MDRFEKNMSRPDFKAGLVSSRPQGFHWVVVSKIFDFHPEPWGR